jgi:hypothetical protein
MVTAALLGGGQATAAWAEDGPARKIGAQVHPGSWTTSARIHSGSWTTSARIRRGTWSTSAPAKTRIRAFRIQTPKDRNKAIAFRLVSRRSWSHLEFRCLDNLWTRESNWNHRAYNPSSGAYGIPQALPASKMGGAGWDWRLNPQTQIRWGLGYIKDRYGSPCGAWGHFMSHNWY